MIKNKAELEESKANSLQIGEITLYSNDLTMQELTNSFVSIITHKEIKAYLKGFKEKKMLGEGGGYVG